MKVYAIANQKGGVGKTTLAVNLAHGFARRGWNTLLVDLDAGTGATTWLAAPVDHDLADFLFGGVPISAYAFTWEARPGFALIPSAKATTAALEYDDRVLKDGTRTLLKRRLAGAPYDVVVLDTGPGVNVLNVNALRAADALVVPVQADYLSLKALVALQEDLREYEGLLGKGNVPPIACVVPTAVQARRRITDEVLAALKNELAVKVAPAVRINARLAEAPSWHKTVYEYGGSRGREDIENVIKYLLKAEVR